MPLIFIRCMQYDRIDPVEMQQLKDEIAQLQTQLAEARETINTQAEEAAANLVKVRRRRGVVFCCYSHTVHYSSRLWRKGTILSLGKAGRTMPERSNVSLGTTRRSRH